MLAVRASSSALRGQGELARAAQLLSWRLGSNRADSRHQGGQGDRSQPSSDAPEAASSQPPPLVPPPLLPASQQPPLHWLDSLGGARLWLEEKNRRWWLKGLLERCK